MLRAKFIGKNFNGFISGNEYNITTDCKLVTGHGLIIPTACLCVYNLENNKQWCPYSRLESFLRNWEIIDGEYNKNFNRR